MTKWCVGQDRVFTFGPLKNNGAAVDPATITFQYKEGRFGAWTSITPTHSGTGTYTATVNPKWGGAVFWQWKTTTPNFADEGSDYCQPSEFSSGWPYGQYDYGFGAWR